MVSANRILGNGNERTVAFSVIQTTDFTEVQCVIANADVAVIPRIHCAGFPMNSLNYLALGCVTLVSEGSFVDLPGAICFPNPDALFQCTILRLQC